jgi:hypothetical protein
MTTDCVAGTWKLKQPYSDVHVDVLDIFCLSKKLRNTPQLAIFGILNRFSHFFTFCLEELCHDCDRILILAVLANYNSPLPPFFLSKMKYGTVK